MGIGTCPKLSDIYPETMAVVGRVLKWHKRLRVIGAEHCPSSGPALFPGNHMKFDDPLVMYRAIYLASGCNIFPRFLARNDIFAGARFSWLIDYNELLGLCGAILFERENVRMAQLKPIIRLLRAGESVSLYQARTRSRTGCIMELPEGSEELGAVSMFAAQAQRGMDEGHVIAVPTARSYNPATKMTTVAFGEPLTLDRNASREERQQFDKQIALGIAYSAEIHAAQLVSALLCMRSIHNITAPVTVEELTRETAQVVARSGRRSLHPGLENNLEDEVNAVLRYLEEMGMVKLDGGMVEMDADAVERVPERDESFKKVNPVKYLTNQIIHFEDVTAAVEDVVLAASSHAEPLPAHEKGA